MVVRNKPLIVMAGMNLARLSPISLMLDPREYAHVVVQSDTPLEYMMGSFRTRPSAAILDMTGSEMIVEYHEAMERNPATRFVFLIEEMSPAAALAKASAGHGVFLAKDESPLTIGATVVSLVKQGSGE